MTDEADVRLVRTAKSGMVAIARHADERYHVRPESLACALNCLKPEPGEWIVLRLDEAPLETDSGEYVVYEVAIGALTPQDRLCDD